MEAALDSNCKDRHGALVAQGNRFYTTGCNNVNRSRFLGKNDICQHAEMDAVTSFNNQYLRRQPLHKRTRKVRKLTVWCVRINEASVTMSLPCKICLFRLKEIGFGKVAFSNKDGMIEIHRLCTLENQHMSEVQKRFADIITW